MHRVKQIEKPVRKFLSPRRPLAIVQIQDHKPGCSDPCHAAAGHQQTLCGGVKPHAAGVIQPAKQRGRKRKTEPQSFLVLAGPAEEKLQELEELDSKGELMLYYADESHVCTNGYVPYGWQFKNEDIYIPSEKAARLNIFGMITKRNQYKGFTTQESIRPLR